MQGGRLLIPGTVGPLAPVLAESLAARGYEPVLLGKVDPADIDVGLAHIDNDVCAATIAALGQFLRYLEGEGAGGDGAPGGAADAAAAASDGSVSVLAPDLCRECRSISLPDLLPGAFARAGYADIAVVPLTSAEALDAALAISAVQSDHVAPAPDGFALRAAAPASDGCPVIGLCGNMPVLTTDEFRHVVVERLEQAGCRVLMPPLDRIADRRDFFTPALEFFAGCGVETVVCILPFGCLGGHAYARVQMRKLLARFDTMELTILDYDPSASDINLVNRTELIIQSARERAGRSA